MAQDPDPLTFRTGRFGIRWDSPVHLVVEDLTLSDHPRIRASLVEWRELAEAIEASAAARELRGSG